MRLFSTLDRKLLRDLWRLRAQSFAIALLIASGVGMVVMSFGMLRSMEETRRAYYDLYRFADIEAPLKRAPEPLLAALRRVPGVAGGAPTQALLPVSLEVADNDFITILGLSGCGKSTLLRLVAGLEEPTTGAVLLDGAVVEGPGADRGVVFQSYTLFPWLNVRQNICFGLRQKGMPAARCGWPSWPGAAISRPGTSPRSSRRCTASVRCSWRGACAWSMPAGCWPIPACR